MKVSLRNDAGVVRQVKVGVSWTTFYFAGIPFFYHNMISQGILWCGLAFFTFGISNLFLYHDKANKKIAQNWLEQGYKPIGDGWDEAAKQWNLSFSSSPTSSGSSTAINSSGHSGLDELAKLAALRDKGVLTNEEFAEKKKQLLGL